MRNWFQAYGTIAAASVIFGIGAANAQTQVPNTFQAGQPARASEVNANFSAVVAATNQNTVSIEVNSQAISDVTQEVTTNKQDIQSVSQAVAALTPPPAYAFAGISSTQLAGNGGFFAMNAACRSAFGGSARVATSVEIMNSVSDPLPAGTADAWIQPVIIGVAAINAPVLLDASGYVGTYLNCSGWSETSGQSGLVVLQDGGISLVPCSGVRPVACAIPPSP